MLCAAMVMTVMFVPSAVITVEAAEDTAIYGDYFFEQDFEDVESNNWGVGAVVGNGRFEVKEDETTLAQYANSFNFRG